MSEPGKDLQNPMKWVAFFVSRRGAVILFALAVLTAMSALDSTSIAVALPVISGELSGSAIEAFWTGTSFLLYSTVFMPIFAAFSNIFGRQLILLFTILLFLVGAVVASVAKQFTHMFVGRCIQGTGGGGITALCEIVITDLVPLRYRGQYFGILAAMWSLGSVLGPILGGGFSQSVTWRWIFYINIPFGVVGFFLVAFFLKMESPTTSLVQKLRQIDYIGIILLVAGLASFLIPLTWGGVLYTWYSWHTICPLVIGGVGLLAFGVYERRFARYPTIPITIFQSRTALVSYAGTVLHGLVLWCLLYYLPLYYEAVKEYSPIMSGVAFFPESFTVAPSAIVTGVIITYTGSYRWAIWLGWAVSTLGTGLLCYMKVESSIPTWVSLNIVPGLGLGLLFPALSFAVQASSTVENMAMATAMFSFSRALGNSIGVAVGGVIFQNTMRQKLQAKTPLASMAVEYSQDAARIVEVIKQMPADLDWEKTLLKEAYTGSVRMIWAVCCGLAGLGLLLSLLTEGCALNRPLEGNQQLIEGREKPRRDPFEESA